MIKAVIYRTAKDDICGFKVTNHGDSILCAAVSMLCINTVNSLETLTDCRLQYCYDTGGGYMECLLPGILSGNGEPGASLLLHSLALGLESARKSYGGGKSGIEITNGVKTSDYAVVPKKHSKTYTR